MIRHLKQQQLERCCPARHTQRQARPAAWDDRHGVGAGTRTGTRGIVGVGAARGAATGVQATDGMAAGRFRIRQSGRTRASILAG